MTSPICSGPEWTVSDLERYTSEFQKINDEKYQLDTYNNQIEIITAEKMIDAYTSHALPVYYPHWSFGKESSQLTKAYKKGQMGLAYEVVINSDPCISYLMEENSSTMQALVISHACFGHNSFFKGNYLFKETSAAGIVDYLVMARRYIMACEEKYGPKEVEVLLDACHSLERQAFDYTDKSMLQSKQEIEEERKQKIEFMSKSISELDTVSPLTKQSVIRNTDNETKSTISFPERNILKFIGKYSVHLEQWQRNIIEIFCYISQYFKPQMQTQLMNEGWATFWHYQFMHDLFDKGLLSKGQMLEFYSSHTSVTSQPGYQRSTGLNVYAVGYEMMKTIKRACLNPTDTDKKYYPFAGCGETEWVNVMKDIMQNYNDESFIQQFLSPDTIERFKLFTIKRDSDLDYMEVTGIATEENYYKIRSVLAESKNLAYNIPNLTIDSYDPKGDRTLTINHRPLDFKRVYLKSANSVMDYVQFLWGDDVIFKEFDRNESEYPVTNLTVSNNNSTLVFKVGGG